MPDNQDTQTPASTTQSSESKPKRKMNWWYWVIALFVFLAVYNYDRNRNTDSGKNSTGSPRQAATVPSTPQGYQFSAKEYKLMKNIIIDGLDTVVNGGDGIIAWNNLPLSVTADKLQRDYQNNEVRGDNAYQGKMLIVSGKVASIDRSVGENSFIRLVGGDNQFISPHAKMADGYRDFLSALNKGQKISLVCKGTGMLVGAATLGNCIPYNVWLKESADTFIKTVPGGIESKNKDVLLMAVITVTLAAEIPDSSPLLADYIDSVQCNTEFEKHYKTFNNEKMKSAADKLKINIDDLK
jgi:hypothetical protein